MQQQNIMKQLQQVIEGTELEWLTPHVFRKASGTAVYRYKGIDASQKHLRHRTRQQPKVSMCRRNLWRRTVLTFLNS